MKERIREFLLAENKSSAQMAEELGVQPSGISHILSGRNNPSLDFILKMLEKYDFICTDWLLFGRGSMYKEQSMQTLFDGKSEPETEDEDQTRNRSVSDVSEENKIKRSDIAGKTYEYLSNKVPGVKRIIWFYADNSFEEYFPQNK